MGSSGGGGSSDPSALMRTAAPMGGLPIAGQDSTVGNNPYEYGQFQSFLPEIKAQGQNPMATGLRPEMFQFNSPYGLGGGGGADAMRNVLAALQAGKPGDAPLAGGVSTPGAAAHIGGPGGVGNMATQHPEYNQPNSAGFTAFSPWAGYHLRAGGDTPVNWRDNEANGPLIEQPKIGW